MRRRHASAYAAALLLVVVMPASAHDPTPNRDGDGYTGSQTLRRVWTSDARLMIDMATGEPFPFKAGEPQP